MSQTRQTVEANISNAKSKLASFEESLKDKAKAKKVPEWRRLKGEIRKYENRLRAIEKYAAREAGLKAEKEAK